jgi:hypothetical protein
MLLERANPATLKPGMSVTSGGDVSRQGLRRLQALLTSQPWRLAQELGKTILAQRMHAMRSHMPRDALGFGAFFAAFEVKRSHVC